MALTASAERDHVPPFALVQRDTLAPSLHLKWAPSPTVTLRADLPWTIARWPDGSSANAPGDLRFGARARLTPATLPVEVDLDVAVKLPNLEYETGLGTDETDTLMRLWVAWPAERWFVQGSAGLGILGHPSFPNAQDDVALLAARGGLALGPVWLLARTDARLASPRNPLDGRSGLGVAWAEGRWQGGMEAGAGWSAAAPDVYARAWIGLHLVRTQDGP